MERLDKHFEKLTKASFARYGFAYGELLARWPEIVGSELSGSCEPERIKWPRGAGDMDQKLGGTLVIRAAPGRSLDLQHQTHNIIERINQFYGYSAISSVKIIQSHEIKSKHMKNKGNFLDDSVAQKLNMKLESISDDALRDALQKLGTGALAEKGSSPHHK